MNPPSEATLTPGRLLRTRLAHTQDVEPSLDVALAHVQGPQPFRRPVLVGRTDEVVHSASKAVPGLGVGPRAVSQTVGPSEAGATGPLVGPRLGPVIGRGGRAEEAPNVPFTAVLASIIGRRASTGRVQGAGRLAVTRLAVAVGLAAAQDGLGGSTAGPQEGSAFGPRVVRAAGAGA